MNQETQRKDDILSLVAEIVAAYVSNNPVPAGDLPAMIRDVYATLGGVQTGAAGDRTGPQKSPAVNIRKSVLPDYIVCLEDGKKLKMLKRYLRSRYGLTPDAYRAKWNLPPEYPMVAPNYAAQRSELAKQIGLGRATPAKNRRRKAG